MSISILAAENPLVPTTAEVMVSIALIVGGLLLVALVLGFIIFLIKRALDPGRRRRIGDTAEDPRPASNR